MNSSRDNLDRDGEEEAIAADTRIENGLLKDAIPGTMVPTATSTNIEKDATAKDDIGMDLCPSLLSQSEAAATTTTTETSTVEDNSSSSPPIEDDIFAAAATVDGNVAIANTTTAGTAPETATVQGASSSFSPPIRTATPTVDVENTAATTSTTAPEVAGTANVPDASSSSPPIITATTRVDVNDIVATAPTNKAAATEIVQSASSSLPPIITAMTTMDEYASPGAHYSELLAEVTTLKLFISNEMNTLKSCVRTNLSQSSSPETSQQIIDNGIEEEEEEEDGTFTRLIRNNTTNDNDAADYESKKKEILQQLEAELQEEFFRKMEHWEQRKIGYQNAARQKMAASNNQPYPTSPKRNSAGSHQSYLSSPKRRSSAGSHQSQAAIMLNDLSGSGYDQLYQNLNHLVVAGNHQHKYHDGVKEDPLDLSTKSSGKARPVRVSIKSTTPFHTSQNRNSMMNILNNSANIYNDNTNPPPEQAAAVEKKDDLGVSSGRSAKSGTEDALGVSLGVSGSRTTPAYFRLDSGSGHAKMQKTKNKNFGMLSRPGATMRSRSVEMPADCPGSSYPGTSYPGTLYPGTSYPGTSYPGEYPGTDIKRDSKDMFDDDNNLLSTFIGEKEGQEGQETERTVEYETLGGDSYSFLIVSRVGTPNFAFGIFVFMIQITTCYLLFQNLISPMVFPANVDTVVRTTQLFAIVLSIVQQDDFLGSIEQLADGYSVERIRPVYPYSSWTKWNLAHCARLTEGLFVLLVSFLVIVQTDSAIEILMNFTAINFISVLDDIAFQLCKAGFFGLGNLQKANEIDSTLYPSRHCKLWKHRVNQFLFGLVIVAMISGWAIIMNNQVYSKYLCHTLYVEFGSNIGAAVAFSSSSGIYDIYKPYEFKNDDRVLYVERRNNIHPDTKRGVFGFCHDDFSWTFSYVAMDENNNVNPDNPGDPCNWVAKANLEGFYDIRNTLNSPWLFKDGTINNQMDQFIILCYDHANGGENNEGASGGLFEKGGLGSASKKNENLFENQSKEGQFGFCPVDTYGLSCGFSSPCPTLEVQESEKVSFFEILRMKEEKGITNSGSNSSIQAYSNPVYISRTENPGDDSLLVFTGSHWVFIDILSFHNFISGFDGTATRNTTATDSNITTVDKEQVFVDIANYFLLEVFHSSSLPYGYVTFMSGAVQSLKPTIPVGIDWYFPKYAPTMTSDGYERDTLESGLPEMDLSRPVGVYITCAFCDSVTNPCMYEGVCQVGGRCKCANGATGTFCEIPPVSNGICNAYFNKPSFNYDGGDCCASTCTDPKSCGVSGLKNAFGTVMATSGNGYANCDDTTMKPITFEFYTNGGGYYFDTKLICNNITYMDIPAYALPPDVDGVEVVYLKDGTDCELSLSLQSTYFVLMDDKPYYDITIKYGNIDDPHAMVLLESKGFFNGVRSGNANDEATTQKFSFIALKDCFMDEIPNINEIVFYDDSIQSGKQYIWDKGTPQGEALRWINEDASIFSSCTERESVTGLTQRYILAIINFATNGMLRQITWLGDTHECEWKPGITCNSNDLLTSLELRDFELTGNIPSEIGLLTGLQKVDLGTNKMSGQIPSSLGDLSNLEFLNLDLNEFSGTIPSEIGRLSNLLLIKIEFNHFKGTLPVEMKNLGKAQILNLGQNELSGTLPTEFGELNVYDLVLSANELTGTIPNELGNLKNIKNMYLLSNSFTGTIPESFGNFTDLRNLLCDDNQLTGSIPIGFGHLTQLGWLNLGRNQLTGQIPTEFGSLTKMTNLDLNTNSFTGPIPSELGHMTNLGVMIFFNNQFSALPSELGHLTKLMKAYLNDNQLQGILPSEMGRMTNLQLLNLYNNFLNGTLATELGNLIQLEDFHVLGNQFTGTLPSEMSRLTKMKRFLLTNNVLSGSIDAISTMSDLEMLRLDYNQFNGTIPTEIGKMTRLELLALQTNQLRGSIPSEIGHITTLQLMFGNGNQLSGTIPSEIGNLNKLTEWTMFINNLSGPIPSEIGNLNLLTKLSIRNMRLTGTIPSEIGRLSALEQVTWSTNAISGKLPSELGRLSVLRVLHAASNQHSGAIPSQLGRIENLGNVDLSGNYLTGTIPKEIGSLISLTNLVLFNNQLSGMPPELRNLVNLVDLLIYGNRFNGNATIPAGICNGQLSRLLVDCGTVICPANCNCRGVQYDPFYFSCPKPETEMESSVQCSKGSFMNLRVEIVPDNLPEETFWDLTINGTVSLQGSAVTDNGFETCVPVNSCSYFTIYDQYGDGMCCSRQTGFGSYTVFLENTVINYGGYFGASESTQIGAAC